MIDTKIIKMGNLLEESRRHTAQNWFASIHNYPLDTLEVPPPVMKRLMAMLMASVASWWFLLWSLSQTKSSSTRPLHQWRWSGGPATGSLCIMSSPHSNCARTFVCVHVCFVCVFAFTLFSAAYLSISSNRGKRGVGMKFVSTEPSKIILDFWTLFFGRRGFSPTLWNFDISDELWFSHMFTYYCIF